MMKIKNIGKRRIKLDKGLAILPGETQIVGNTIGAWAVKVNTDIIEITPKKVPKPKFKPTYKYKSFKRGE